MIGRLWRENQDKRYKSYGVKYEGDQSNHQVKRISKYNKQIMIDLFVFKALTTTDFEILCNFIRKFIVALYGFTSDHL